MLRTKSGRKAHRASLKRRVFNARHKKSLKDATKAAAKAVLSKEASTALATLPAFFKAVDKAAKHGTIKKNTASRMKSRFAKRLAALGK